MGHIKHVHFVGVGGVGMAGIAEVLLRQGYTVSGSDVAENPLTQWLKLLGATIYITHAAQNVANADVIVRSSAIDSQNIELQTAREAQIPIVARAEMLGELMRFRYGIAVAGTHGKTTTTSLITSILAEAALDPTFVIGGKLNSVGSNARLGQGHYIVAEADESDASFLYLKPMISVVTNIDEDHMDTYNHDFQQLKNTFIEFINKLPFYGLSIVCQDDPIVREILPELSRPFLTYGFNQTADYHALDYTQDGVQTEFLVYRPRGKNPLPIHLNLPGRHNVLNALAAVAVASELKVADHAIQSALQRFAGIGRRFQLYGQYPLAKGGTATLVDDYGHHPREVEATIQAARKSWPNARIVMVYQPHRYTRTRDLFKEFCRVLSSVDQLLLLDVYSAGEEKIIGAESKNLIEEIKKRCASAPIHVKDHRELPDILQRVLLDKDILLCQGAGNIGALAANLANTIHSRVG